MSIEELIKNANNSVYNKKHKKSKSTQSSVLEFLKNVLWEKDYQTEEHVSRLKGLVVKMGRYIKLSKEEIQELSLVAAMHDIGKIAVPGEILRKPGPLTSDEWEIMKKHPEVGCRIIQATKELSHISEAILYHHEWWNGKGYPQGLKEEEIPLFSRIVAIIDSYDVMIHDRPYKSAMNRQDALMELERCAGIQYDPSLVRMFINMMHDTANDSTP